MDFPLRDPELAGRLAATGVDASHRRRGKPSDHAPVRMTPGTTMVHDAFNLKRFVDAQEPIYEEALLELERGHKRTHWMWFVFPQLADLGRSAMAKHFGIHSLEEAAAYWRHPVLGARLRQCCGTLLGLEGCTAHGIFGSPDDLKLRSCLTLFELAAPGDPVFAQCLEKYYAGRRDELTQALCRSS